MQHSLSFTGFSGTSSRGAVTNKTVGQKLTAFFIRLAAPTVDGRGNLTCDLRKFQTYLKSLTLNRCTHLLEFEHKWNSTSRIRHKQDCDFADLPSLLREPNVL